VRIAIVFDRDDDGYRLGEYLDSDVQPVFLAYRDREGNNVFLASGEWTPEELADGLESLPSEHENP
jgi:hypothetical protein